MKNNNKILNSPIIGYLSPDGELIKCSSWEHSDCAQRIAKKLGCEHYLNGVDAEIYIFDRGYICFRQNDAYCNYYASEDYLKEQGYDSNAIMINKLTAAQIEFMNTHNKACDWNSAKQAEDVFLMLEYQEKLIKMEQTPDVVVNPYQ